MNDSVFLPGIICIYFYVIFKKRDLRYNINKTKITLLIKCHNICCLSVNFIAFICMSLFLTNPQISNMTLLNNFLCLTKVFELNDTFIMILRKSFNQITPLHIYHHSSSLILIWFITRNNLLTFEIGIGILLNCCIHTLLYLYYYLSFSLIKNKEARNKYLWWSWYLTMLHFFQYVVNIYNCGMNLSKHYIYCIGLVHQLSLFYLYGRFFVKKKLRAMKET